MDLSDHSRLHTLKNRRNIASSEFFSLILSYLLMYACLKHFKTVDESHNHSLSDMIGQTSIYAPLQIFWLKVVITSHIEIY